MGLGNHPFWYGSKSGPGLYVVIVMARSKAHWLTDSVSVSGSVETGNSWRYSYGSQGFEDREAK